MLASGCYDALVIGGGFYGCAIALFLRQHFQSVLLVERETDLLTRASLVNQARVHNGYHYPRSFVTALRSFVNFPRFVSDYEECLDSSFEQYYAIARTQTKTNAVQFLRVFSHLGIPLRSAKPSVRRLFSTNLIEDVLLTTEYAFNAVALRRLLGLQLERARVEVQLGCSVARLCARQNGSIAAECENGMVVEAARVYNCTYSGINRLLRASGLPLLRMKHELAEIALMQPPPELEGIGITVMDGPFFSTMPFPARSLYSLSHVRYTPHASWRDDDGTPAEPNSGGVPKTNFPFMIRDAVRYVPCMSEARYVDSLFDTKTVMLDCEIDDGRPILYREDHGIRNLFVVMGGKIDNVYDILQVLESKRLADNRAVAQSSI
jgi:glycine/D-amino acid oxidase-like deaminating enzyme